MGRLPAGVDLLETITRVVNEEEITCGTISVYGSLENATLQSQIAVDLMQGSLAVDSVVEIGSASGTLSLFKRRVLPRISCVLRDRDGVIHTGILAIGSSVRSCEVVITEAVGGSLSRDFDPVTGQPEWKATSLLVQE